MWRNTFVGAAGWVPADQSSLDNFLAMWAAPWAPAAISYAERIVYLPLGVVATAFATAVADFAKAITTARLPRSSNPPRTCCFS